LESIKHHPNRILQTFAHQILEDFASEVEDKGSLPDVLFTTFRLLDAKKAWIEKGNKWKSGVRIAKEEFERLEYPMDYGVYHSLDETLETAHLELEHAIFDLAETFCQFTLKGSIDSFRKEIIQGHALIAFIVSVEDMGESEFDEIDPHELLESILAEKQKELIASQDALLAELLA